MPKLLLFAVCEKVIIELDTNLASLISVMQELTIGIPPNAPIPDSAVLPMKWHAFTVWVKQTGDEEKRYVQELELCDPDSKVLLKLETEPFEMNLSTYRGNLSFNTFPITQLGGYSLKLYLREIKEGEERKEVASYPLNIKRLSA